VRPAAALGVALVVLLAAGGAGLLLLRGSGTAAPPAPPGNPTVTEVADPSGLMSGTWTMHWSTSAAGSVEGFRVYEGWVQVGEGTSGPASPTFPNTCPNRVLLVVAPVSAQSTVLPNDPRVPPYSYVCYWVAAYNGVGESALVRAPIASAP
jgi:hypothetical protein